MHSVELDNSYRLYNSACTTQTYFTHPTWSRSLRQMKETVHVHAAHTCNFCTFYNSDRGVLTRTYMYVSMFCQCPPLAYFQAIYGFNPNKYNSMRFCNYDLNMFEMRKSQCKPQNDPQLFLATTLTFTEPVKEINYHATR